MAYRVLELNLISANDVKKVTLFSRMRVYAVASISGGDPRMPTHGTQADRYGGCSPAWNSVFHFPIPSTADTRGLALHVRLRTERVFGARDVGDVFVPIDDLLAGAGKARDSSPVTYQVRRPRSGRAHGVICFCYKFIDVPAASAAANKEGNYYAKYSVQESSAAADKVTTEPVTAYPPPQQAYQPVPPYGSAYPPQTYYYPYNVASQPYGHNAAPQPAASYGYAAASPAKQHHGGGGMRMGLGLGLLGGAVGGMMVGEMIGDAEADAADDAGFNDGLSF
jgi:hypothetical protein